MKFEVFYTSCILIIFGNMACNSRQDKDVRGWRTMRKIGYAICTNCGCNKTAVEIYRCQSCGKMYCKKCVGDITNCPNSECGTRSLEHKGYIQPFDEI